MCCYKDMCLKAIGMIKVQTLFLISVLCLALVSCGSKNRQTDRRPLLTVSIEPLRYFVQAVGGDKVQVVSMVPDGTSPETYDPTPQQLMALSRSRAFLRIGYIGYERVWADKLQQNAPRVKFFDMSEEVPLLGDSDEEHDGHVHAGGVDPHIWNSVSNANVIAYNVYKALCETVPADEAYFKHRLDSLKQEIQRIDGKVKACLAGGQTAFLIYHPALTYFAHEYGLHQISIEKGGKEPSPAYLQQLIKRCRKEGVKTIFVQKEFDERNAEIIAHELGVKIITINPLSSDWVGEIIRMARALSGQD